jgi:lipoprotein LprG
MIRTVRSLGVALALSALATTACTDDDSGGAGGDTPDAAALVSAAAAATREVETVRFTLDVEGTVPGISIRSAEGRLTRAGEVEGTAVLLATGQPVETEFVVVGDTLYLKGPTGGFQKLPASVAASVYDPTKILDDHLGLAALVAGATQPAVQDTEDVDGTRAHRVQVVFAKNNLGVLLPGVGATADLPGELWLAAEEPNRPLRARVQVPADGGEPGGTVTITLSQFNEPVDITPPS